MEKRRILVSLLTNANDFQRQQAKAAQEAADRLNVPVEIIYAGDDSITQSEQLFKAIQDDELPPAGILVQPAGGTALHQVARAAASTGIGWGVLNREAEYISELRTHYQVPMFIVTSDHAEIGRIQGRQVRALLPKGGTVLYLQGPSLSAAAKQRTAGMNETKPQDVHIKTLKCANWTREAGSKAVESWLRLSTSKDEHIDLIAAQGDELAAGARSAFQGLASTAAQEKRLRLPITGVDGLTSAGQKWVKDGWLTATVVVPPNAGDALALMVNALATGAQPPELTMTVPSSHPVLEKLGNAATST